MNIHIIKRVALGVGFGTVLVAGVPHLVGAISTNDTSTLREEAKALREEKKQQAQETLKAKRAAKCESQKEHISQVMASIDNRSERIYDRLTTVSELIRSYYEKSGLTVDNYDALVSDIDQKRTEAKAKLDVMSTHEPFNCSVENPRESIMRYRDNRRAKVTAMKAYRQSIRTLLTEIKSAAAAKSPTSNQKDGGNL